MISLLIRKNKLFSFKIYVSTTRYYTERVQNGKNQQQHNTMMESNYAADLFGHLATPVSKNKLELKSESGIISVENLALIQTLLPPQWHSIHPTITADLLIDKIKESEKMKSSDIVKPIVSDLIEYLAGQDLHYTTQVLFHFMKGLGPVSVSQLMRGALTSNQIIVSLAILSREEDWRQYGVFDLMIELMSASSSTDIMKLISFLPHFPVSTSTVERTEIAMTPEEISKLEPDFLHPQSYWGYKKKTADLDKLEEEINRLTTPVSSISYTTSGHTRKGYSDESTGEVMLHMPYKPHSSEWFPDEIGAMIGRLFADEWELDYITYLLIDFVTLHFGKNAKECCWQDFMGYAGIIISSAMSVNKHWENEDIVWVYKDFCIDVGKWALNTWPDFRELEYREWLADIISLIAIRRGEVPHDSKLISSLMDELCEDWDYEKADYLGYMIEARMKEKTFPYKQKNDILKTLRVKKADIPTLAPSHLWTPPEEYYISEKWEEKHEQLKNVGNERLNASNLEMLNNDFERVQEETKNRTEEALNRELLE